MTSPTVWFKASRCQCAAAIRRRAERDKLGPSCCCNNGHHVRRQYEAVAENERRGHQASNI
jgi:hypothetical protein